MSGRSRLGDTRGFTLLETMVALTVAALVALLLHRGVGEVGEMGRRAAAHRAEAAHAAAVRRQLAGWLRGVYVDPAGEGRRFDGEDGSREGEVAPDRLRFWTSSASWERAGALQVTLAVEPGAGLVAQVRDRTDPGPAEGTRRMVLVPEAEGLELRYYLDLGGERRWVGGWSSLVRLPEAVELRITGERVPPLLRAPMLVALHGG